MGKDKHRQMMVSVVQQARHQRTSLLSIQLYEAFSILPTPSPSFHPSSPPIGFATSPAFRPMPHHTNAAIVSICVQITPGLAKLHMAAGTDDNCQGLSVVARMRASEPPPLPTTAY